MADSSLNTPMVVIIRDGWGRNPNPEHDAFNGVKLANTPKGDALLEHYPYTLIHTSSEPVGLPDGTMGNSEVGHQNIGAGRIVDQESVRITKATRDGSFHDNEAVVSAIEFAKANDRYVQLIGIASDAGVHGQMIHLYACVEACKKHGHDKVAIHLLTDGRDTGPFTGKGYIAEIQAKLDDIGAGEIVSLCGRYYAMDRDNRWERVQKAYRLLTEGNYAGEVGNYENAAAAIQDYYDNPFNDSQQGDEFVLPRTIAADGDPTATRIQNGDAVIFYNYRGDRPREITRAFMQPDFYGNVPPSPDSGEKGFDRGEQLDLRYVCMTAYDQSFYEFPNLSVAFQKPPKIVDIAGQWIAEKGLKQFRCAETEKFPHVTFFFNDYREEPFDGESREMAQSPSVATHDLQPEMSAYEVRDLTLAAIKSGEFDVIIVNFANGDMVGHTGKLDAVIKAVETVDSCVDELVQATLAQGGQLIVTADHGNAEQMFDPATNAPHTAHTLYDVECILVDERLKDKAVTLREGGKLADVMPTAFTMMGLDQPEAMTGESLITTDEL